MNEFQRHPGAYWQSAMDARPNWPLHYDTAAISGQALLQTLRWECPQATVPVVAPKTQRPPRMTSRPIAAEIGKMALGVLVNKGVSYSLAPLLRSPV